MRLSMLAALAPSEAEPHALVALMEIQASRLRARNGPNGEIVTLDRQDRARWDRLLITHGLTALDRVEALGGTGSYAIQAQIAACHDPGPDLPHDRRRAVILIAGRSDRSPDARLDRPHDLQDALAAGDQRVDTVAGADLRRWLGGVPIHEDVAALA